MSEFTPTPEQEAIIEAMRIANRSGVMVEAGAGCAKTSTLTLASRVISVPGLAVAFNKRIAVELEKRLSSNFDCKTMNGLGHVAWAKAIGRKSNGLKVDERKAGKLISEMAKARKSYITTEQWDYARILFREAQIQGLVPEPFGSQLMTLLPDTKEGWQELSDSHAIPDDDFDVVWELAREALIEDIRMAYQGVVSYDDQVYCSTLLGGKFYPYPCVMVDEYQDLNPLQILMIKRSLSPDSRLMTVGDNCQGIYAWRGAVGDAAEQLKKLRPEWVDLPLMTSFRVPQLVADRQKGHVPLFRAHGANPPGQVFSLGSKDWGSGDIQGWTWRMFTDKLPEDPMDTVILCRNNAPIISLAFKLIRQQVGCHVLGRDISKGLKALTKKLAPEDGTKSDIVRGRVQDWCLSEVSKARLADNPDAIDKFTDKAESIIAVIDSTQCVDAGQLRRMLDNLFDRESGMVTLSTIHKAKGLEWGAVMHLDPWRIPSKFALKQGGRAMQQEKNLKYVAETRTKHTLAMASLEGFQ